MKKLILVIVLALVACSKRPESTTKAGVDFTVDKLFTVDGCTVYRFGDGGETHYFTNCRGTTINRTSCDDKNNCVNADVTGGK